MGNVYWSDDEVEEDVELTEIENFQIEKLKNKLMASKELTAEQIIQEVNKFEEKLKENRRKGLYPIFEIK